MTNKEKTSNKARRKETVIIIHGLNSGNALSRKKYYGELIYALSKDYNVLFFSWNKERTTDQLADDLRSFIKNNKVSTAHFICHSFGSVIFRVFYQKPDCKIRKVIFVAPLVRGAKILEYSFEKYTLLSRKILGKASEDLLEKKKKIFGLPLPRGILVVAGTKKFRYEVTEAYILALSPDFDLKNSDGKVHLKETETPGMKERFLVNEYHDYLPNNEKVIGKIGKFLGE